MFSYADDTVVVFARDSWDVVKADAERGLTQIRLPWRRGSVSARGAWGGCGGWACRGAGWGRGGRLPAALGALALLLLLLAGLAPPAPATRPRPRPRPLVSLPLSAEASSTTYGNRTRDSSAQPDTTNTGPGGASSRAEGPDLGDNVAFDDNGASKVNEVNKVNEISKVNEVGKVNELTKVNEISKVNDVSKANDGVSKVNEGVSKVNEGVSKVNVVSKGNDGSNKVSEGDAGTKVGSSAAKSSTLKGVLLTRDLMVEGHSKVHPEICPALGAKVKVLILVTSAPSHFAPRNAIRLTWGHFAARADVALGFVLGVPPDQLRRQIDEEDALYGDIIEGLFVDAYTNLTLKTLSMLEWARAYCPRARALLKTDDDMFINVPLLLDFQRRRANATNTIWGKVLHKALPKRTPKSKYYLSPAQFPARVLPDFATGPAYLMTRDVVDKLREAAPDEKYLCLEDVFVTGVLAARLRVARVAAPQFHNKRAAPPPGPGPCALRRRIALHMVKYHEQFDLWRKLLDGQAKCS